MLVKVVLCPTPRSAVLNLGAINVYGHRDFQVGSIEMSWEKQCFCPPFSYKVVVASKNGIMSWASLKLWGPGYMNVNVVIKENYLSLTSVS